MALVTDPTPIGPVLKDWAQFFGELAAAALGQNSYNDPNSSDQTETIVVLSSATDNWTWTENIVTTVTSCPVPNTTLQPSTTLYPC